MDKNSQPTCERWTARRKADLVLEIIIGQRTIVDAAREYDLIQRDIQNWIDTFMEYGRQSLRANPKKVHHPYSTEQNGAIERFVRTLKEECIWLNTFATLLEAKAVIEA